MEEGDKEMSFIARWHGLIMLAGGATSFVGLAIAIKWWTLIGTYVSMGVLLLGCIGWALANKTPASKSGG
jgi:hypothetical protein